MWYPLHCMNQRWSNSMVVSIIIIYFIIMNTLDSDVWRVTYDVLFILILFRLYQCVFCIRTYSCDRLPTNDSQ